MVALNQYLRLNLTGSGGALDFIHIVSSDPKYAGNLLTNMCRPTAAAHMEYDVALFIGACSSSVCNWQCQVSFCIRTQWPSMA